MPFPDIHILQPLVPNHFSWYHTVNFIQCIHCRSCDEFRQFHCLLQNTRDVSSSETSEPAISISSCEDETEVEILRLGTYFFFWVSFTFLFWYLRGSHPSQHWGFFFIAEQFWQLQAVNRYRVGWTGVNSIDINWIIYRELMVWRSLMTKANFPPWTCLWHWKVKNLSRTKRTDSGETLFIKIYILQCHWLLLFIMFFRTIAWNSNLLCFYHSKTFSWMYCTLHNNKPSAVCSFQLS